METILRAKINRGSRQHEGLLSDKESNLIVSPKNRGRDRCLLDIRNLRLFHRYYFYTRIVKKPYAETLLSLSFEFTLSVRTIADIFQKEGDTLNSIFKEEKPTLKELENKYSFMNWKM